MDPSLLIAKILGPLFVIVTLGVLFNLGHYLEVGRDFLKQPALRYLGGVGAFVFGVMVIEFHNVWVADWTLIITLMGWTSFVKGMVLLLAPATLMSLFEGYLNNTTAIRVHMVVGFLLGAFLTVMGHG